MADLSVFDSVVFTSVLLFCYGLLFGSFANVIILRLPKNMSVVKPRSKCPKCEKSIRWFDLIPVISWVLLGAKCRNCKAKIHWRYPLVELLMGALFCGMYLKVGWSWLLLEYLIFSFGLVVVSFIDLDHMILPDSFTLSGVVLGLLGGILNPARELMPAVWGVLFGGGFLWAVAYIYYLIRKEEGMGGGDIKLLAWIGAILGWTSVPFVILVSSIIGTVFGVFVALKNKAGMRSTIPFGPYLALAALLYIFWGQELAQWYMDLFIPSLTQAH